MQIKEYRIVMPLEVDEYKIGQLFSFAQASLNETGGGEGIEIVRNEPFDNFPLFNGRYSRGQYTYKKYYLASKAPAFIRFLIPNQSMVVHEESWNAFPYTRTLISNPGYMKENFLITIDSLHLAGRHEDCKQNLLELCPEKLKLREVVLIDISNDPVQPSDYKANEDPAKFKSEKNGRGPLVGLHWKDSVTPVMTVIKLVSVEFKWFGLQNRVESTIHRGEQRLFTNFHRQIFCWTDLWWELSIDDLRIIEERIHEELVKQRKDGQVRGMRVSDTDN